MLLMLLLTGELVAEANDARSLLLARDDADDDDDERRNEVRRLCGEKRAVMVWTREGCMVDDVVSRER
jgi:hypothetical protein